MIKNIIYSLFLHLVILLLIYFKLNNLIQEKIILKDEGISVSISYSSKPINKPQSASSYSASSPINNDKNDQKNIEEIDYKKEKTLDQNKKNPESKKNKTDKAVASNIKNIDVKSQEIQSLVEDKIEKFEDINLSAREKFNIQLQLNFCYHRAIINRKKSLPKITLPITISKEGLIQFNRDDIRNFMIKNKIDNEYYDDYVQYISETIEFCSPLKNLPEDKYDIWKEFLLEFK